MSWTFLFDIDGTLTPSRLPIDPRFEQFFKTWMQGKRVIMVSGSDYAKSLEQLGPEILNQVELSYNNAGNTAYKQGKECYRFDWAPSQELLAFFETELNNSPYLLRTANHIEIRIGMVNFSIVGRAVTLDQRLEYFEYDNQVHERERICKKLMAKFPDLEANIGGQISIDVYPKGRDKSQIIPKIPHPICFFGDRTEPGGNDYCIAQKLLNSPHKVFTVADWRETMEILQKFN